MPKPSVFERFYKDLTQWLHDIEEHEGTRIVEIVEYAKKLLLAAESLPEEKVKQFIDNFAYDLKEFYEQNQEEAKHSIYLGLMKESFWSVLANITDKSQVEWAELCEDFEQEGDYQVGDMIGFGQLTCRGCGHSILISHLSEVLPCLECGHRHFKRNPLQP
ncbi:zinc ribbon-containing protein [Thalassotalea fusca]